jgi:hypothetical protein
MRIPSMKRYPPCHLRILEACPNTSDSPQDIQQYIVAINKDKEANIFSVAHFGIVGDYKKVLLALTAQLKELKSK